MKNPVIRVENISKRYRLGVIGGKTLREDMQRWWSNVRKKPDPFAKIGQEDIGNVVGSELWALKNVSFEVKQGEILGIIGKNGAGKSTLLKILSKITAPSTGKLKVKGRIGSLLEVGTGFHPELTGRENIFLNGAILGMTKNEIKSKFDEIVLFSEIREFIDTPVKRYSSGMHVRLAFSVAAHLEPEILIVDEVLAVGDLKFQKKCLGKMGDISCKGRTILFVSHNLNAIRNLCNSCILLDKGRVVEHGEVARVVRTYEKRSIKFQEGIWKNSNEREKNDVAYIEAVKMRNSCGEICSSFINTEAVEIVIDIVVKKNVSGLKVGFECERNGSIVFRTHQIDCQGATDTFKPGNIGFIVRIPPSLLNGGEYYIKPLISLHRIRSLTEINNAVLSFNVKISDKISEYHLSLDENNNPGYIFPLLAWKEIYR